MGKDKVKVGKEDDSCCCWGVTSGRKGAGLTVVNRGRSAWEKEGCWDKEAVEGGAVDGAAVPAANPSADCSGQKNVRFRGLQRCCYRKKAPEPQLSSS